MPPFSPEEIAALRVSLVVGARAIVFALPLAILAAYALARGRFWGRALLDALVHAPLVLPPVVVGYGLLLIFGIQGPVGAWLDRSFGLRLAFTSAGASLAAGVCAFPLMVRAVRLSLEAVDEGLDVAASSLGAGPFDRAFSVILPLAAPGILSAAVVGFAACLGEFGAVITFAANVPGVTQTLPLAVYSALQAPGGEAMAARLAGVSLILALGGLFSADYLARAARRWVGR